MKPRFIQVARPTIGLREIYSVLSAVLLRELSGYSQQYIPRFEKKLASIVGTNHAIVVNSGTSAIHLALVGLGVGKGDKVAVASYTNMATFFPVLQLGATPIPVDVEMDSWNMDPEDLKKIITKDFKAIVVVHIFGHPALMLEIMRLADEFGIPVIEDCAEALGSTSGSMMVGSIGKIGCHSFYANKMITTGEGGAITTNDDEIADKIRSYRSLSFGNVNKFMHKSDGYNYRMSNLQAAIGYSQLFRLNKIIKQKQRIASRYRVLLESDARIQLPGERSGQKNVYWMYHIRLLNFEEDTRNLVIKELEKLGIETRPAFIPYSEQVNVLKKWEQKGVRETPSASLIAKQGLYLPSGPRLSRRKIKLIADALKQSLDVVGNVTS